MAKDYEMTKRKSKSIRSNLRSIKPHDYDGYITYLSDLLIQRSIQLHERPIGDDLFSLVGIEVDQPVNTLMSLVLVDNPECIVWFMETFPMKVEDLEYNERYTELGDEVE